MGDEEKGPIIKGLCRIRAAKRLHELAQEQHHHNYYGHASGEGQFLPPNLTDYPPLYLYHGFYILCLEVPSMKARLCT